ncbi:hypothetical protein [Methylobacterium indicum]|uniref:Uncharacterized protein n=1 Tax=Methylobacterium indicum TaxID=1775910 RepID=A0ABR5HG17_9HYPH|nr:hypothetical protein [Methylobacterium indicum]KMO17462.1 hypothetical protein QR78_17495 [Methylobacterium indicum]KMO25550.1 hypothetical protein QR79_06685 [Methylobacterium indicum]
MLRLVALGIILAAAATILVVALRPPLVRAQEDAYCRPPLKFAAGACVARCPAGYEDRGQTCVFRSLSR